MTVRQRRYSKEELARRGQELYETGEFEVDENIVPATNRLFERYPNAQPWVIRIGHRAVDHFGARSLKQHP
jgi:hypothetical protein